MAGITGQILNAMHSAGTFSTVASIQPRQLTVLNYHRISYADDPEFNLFRPVLSATPQGFDEQIAYCTQHHNFITNEQLVGWLGGEQDLPDHPAMITFDDGYRDNYEHAFPVLKKHGVSAIIFLATDYIENSIPFFWDLAAYCFSQTDLTRAELPGVGTQTWSDAASREQVMKSWIELLKALDDDEKSEWVSQLPDILNVEVHADTFAGVTMSWEQVRELVANGIEMGAHTASHPILTRIPLGQVRSELSESKRIIEEKTGTSVTALAYPNGGSADFNSEVVNIVKEVGFKTAYTLLSGPTSLADVKQNPLTIRRIYITHKDTIARFAASASGLKRILGRS